jgi:hypothetical protein
MSRNVLEIAGMAIALRCEDPSIRWRWNEAAARFLVEPRAADVELTVMSGDLDGLKPPSTSLRAGTAPLFDSGAVWRIHRQGVGYRIECQSDKFGNAPYKIAIFNDDFTRGGIAMRRDLLSLELGPLDYPLDEVLVAHLLGRGRGVELHSCGIIDSAGRGHLFVGVSGAGKTTTARLWGEDAKAIVSDDRVIIREQDGVMRMYGTPWHGEARLSLAVSAPLAGVYLLMQSTSNELRAIPRAEAVARLFGCAFPPLYDAAAVDFTLNFLDRIAERVPVRELRFTRDRGAVDLVLGEAA